MLLVGKIKGVVFDLEGTLIDSAKMVLEAWSKAFEDNGYRVNRGVLDGLIGASPAKIIREIAGNINDDVFEKLEKDFNTNLAARVHLVKPFPDSVQALKTLRSEDARIGAVSASSSSVVEALLAKTGLMGLVDASVGGDEVLAGKPDPQIYREAFRRIGVAPAMGAVVGCSDYDAIPAKKLGALAIVVNRGNPRTVQADLVFNNLVDAVTEILNS
ncbi:MAG: HAD family phosphatase [Thermoprotei archaeon]